MHAGVPTAHDVCHTLCQAASGIEAVGHLPAKIAPECKVPPRVLKLRLLAPASCLAQVCPVTRDLQADYEIQGRGLMILKSMVWHCWARLSHGGGKCMT